MVTDAMLKAAATRARDAKRIFLESQMLTPRTFSPKFESRIKKVAWRADHPVLFGALRYGLAVLLIAALLAISTAYIVDSSFNPFLYFRF